VISYLAPMGLLHEAPEVTELRELAQSLETGVRHFRLAFGIDPGRDAWIAIKDQSAIERELDRLTLLLGSLKEALGDVAERGKGLESCHKRALTHSESLARFVTNPADGAYVHWYETYRTGFSLNMTPMTVAEPFQKAMAAMNSSWIFTSATLAVGGDFSHFRGQLGIEDTEELQVDSPFDYRHNALLYPVYQLSRLARSGSIAQRSHTLSPIGARADAQARITRSVSIGR